MMPARIARIASFTGVFDGATEIARHVRSYDAGAQIEDAAHIDALVQHKGRSRGHRGVDRVSRAVPAASVLLAKAAERGENVDEARQRFISEYEDTLANPYIAAERGYIDTVITPSNTRMNVTKALRALRNKRETLPPKKHGNIPL